MEKKRSIIGLMGSLLINNILYMFINTFMVAYFYTLNYDYKIISVFYIMSFIFIVLTFLTLGKIIKNKLQVPIFRFGIVLYCIYVLTISILKENIVNYYIYLGIFYGIVQGFLWSAGHLLVNEYANDVSNKFVSTKSMLSKTLKIIFPFIFGASIELTSFSSVATVVVVLSIIQFSFSLLIKEKDLAEAKKYSLTSFVKYLKEIKEEKIKDFYKIMFCEGIVNYLLETLVTIMIVLTFKTNISLGILTTIFSFCSIVSVYIFQRKLKNNTTVLSISTIISVLGVILLLFNISKVTVIIYNLINNIFLIVLVNNAEEKRYNIINDYKIITKDYLAEHQVISEVSLNIARIIGYTVLFAISFFNNMLYFKILLICVSIEIIYYSRLMIKLNKN